MANKMLIDAAHPEETRVVVVRGKRVEEFDYESAQRKQLRGNIYLAKVTRVEPSLQAAFVDYGGNRHGFLAFNEIHPDYYQIPVADREALLEEEAEEESRAVAEEEAAHENEEQEKRKPRRRTRRGGDKNSPASKAALIDEADEAIVEIISDSGDDEKSVDEPALENNCEGGVTPLDVTSLHDIDSPSNNATSGKEDADSSPDDSEISASYTDNEDDEEEDEEEIDAGVESVGSEDALEEVPVRPRRKRRKIYKIQEVIRRRQIILIQVVKEERGNKGAALTTYLSLAGRYTVLMPNTARGGGISRKITNTSDRKRLRKIAGDLEVAEGMGLIIRTAGASRTKAEIKRDFDYLLRLWENIRQLTLESQAPTLVYEEGNLIKRSIRDLYNKDIDEVLVAGDTAYKEAKGFMRMLTPSHAKNVHHYKETEPLFMRFGIERQLNAMYSPFVTLKSGGYIVINQTEALVAIDVNSGKATKEYSIEETALNTNLEAAEEVARQLRLRDLAGLIVIDYIDMEERRNNRAVERRMKDCLRTDRARIQVGRISAFGLMEMSRQRLRTGVLEGSTSSCDHCQGTGVIRSTESVALYVLRSVEDVLMGGEVSDLKAITAVDVALYILNQKRGYLENIESNVHHYKETEPLFMRFGIERQLNAMYSPFVTLKSGGYIVINQTEALVAIDVNSGKATKEYSIEETALNTNLEAAEEVARQLRLRDLAGLIVIDYIDMEERRNNRAVERRMKDCLRTDRARIQVGRISAFGLMEMSRQRLRTGVLEGSTSSCDHCQGTGVIRSTESVALYVLRSVEDVLMGGEVSDLKAITAVDVALYILNQKRGYLENIESQYGISIDIEASERLQGSNFSIEKVDEDSSSAANDNVVIKVDWAYQAPESPKGKRGSKGQSRPQQKRNQNPRRARSGGSGNGRRKSANTDSGTTEMESVEKIGGSDNGSEGEEKTRRPRRRGRRGGRGRNTKRAPKEKDTSLAAPKAPEEGDQGTRSKTVREARSGNEEADASTRSTPKNGRRTRAPRKKEVEPTGEIDTKSRPASKTATASKGTGNDRQPKEATVAKSGGNSDEVTSVSKPKKSGWWQRHLTGE